MSHGAQQSDKDLLSHRISQLEHKTDEAYNLAKYAAQRHIELRAEMNSLQTIQETIMRSQERVDERIYSIEKIFSHLDNKITANLKWSIATILTTMIAFAGLMIALLKLGY